jgi:hypothetical protein
MTVTDRFRACIRFAALRNGTTEKKEHDGFSSFPGVQSAYEEPDASQIDATMNDRER